MFPAAVVVEFNIAARQIIGEGSSDWPALIRTSHIAS